MKKIVGFIAGIFILLCLFGCSNASTGSDQSPPQEHLSQVGKVLNGEHRLQKTFLHNESNIYASSYFYFTKDCLDPSDRTNANVVYFSWQTNDGSFIISSLPLNNCRILINDSIEEPTIKFCWRNNNFQFPMQEIMRRSVYYAVITIQSADWPIPISITNMSIIPTSKK